ncbi:MAG TPA: GntR family transcriptional regulator, partial [Trueperaceae bacterium]|nr:GntR family transcriptional regulator [Trueperaceae bacterium]
HFRPGERLVERDLTERYEVSRTPLREALKELVRSQLAVTVPYRGVVVRQVSLGFAREVYELRAGLDSMAAALAAARATRTELDRLRGIYDAIDKLSEPVPDESELQSRRDQIMLLNGEFHRTIAQATHNALILAKHDELWVSISLVRSAVWQTAARTQSSREEHAAILEAIATRSVDTARKLCALHADRAWEYVRAAFPTLPKPPRTP